MNKRIDRHGKNIVPMYGGSLLVDQICGKRPTVVAMYRSIASVTCWIKERLMENNSTEFALSSRGWTLRLQQASFRDRKDDSLRSRSIAERKEDCTVSGDCRDSSIWWRVGISFTGLARNLPCLLVIGFSQLWKSLSLSRPPGQLAWLSPLSCRVLSLA